MVRTETKPNRNPYIPFTFKMLNSEAYKSLPPSACKALLFFLAKVKLPETNPWRYWKSFTLSYGELKASAKISDKTCSKVFQSLVEFGFIDPVSKGGLRGGCKVFSTYKLSKRWEKYGKLDFQEIDLKTFGV